MRDRTQGVAALGAAPWTHPGACGRTLRPACRGRVIFDVVVTTYISFEKLGALGFIYRVTIL